MGKSASCLRIIPCAGGDQDEAGAADETKRSKAKKMWSFRKKSSSSRAVSNSLIAETPHKKNPESPAVNFESANESIVPEKEKKPPPSMAVPVSQAENHPGAVDLHLAEKQPDAADFCITDDSRVSKTEYEAVLTVHESSATVIQSAIRGFLARREQVKHKSVVKVQAAVRGHLVRCHAVGALRCVQAIAKMQVLIRARYARQDQSIKSNENGTRSRKDFKPLNSRPEIVYTSMTELLSNSFARQLLKSSPKSKPIKIKFDPLRRDSSWVWLERWMSLASPVSADDHTTGVENGQELKNIGKEQAEKIVVEDYLFHEENEIFSDAKDFASSGTSGECSKTDIIEEAHPVNSDAAYLIERQKPDTTREVDDTAESAGKIDSVNLPVNASVNSQPEIISVNERAQELETEVGAEEEVMQLETEDGNTVSGSGEECSLPVIVKSEIEDKVSVPDTSDFCDSKPEQLSVRQNAREPIWHVQYTSASQNAEAGELVPQSCEFELSIETGASSGDEIIINHRELSQPAHSGIRVGESECGTELSVTSTLDSPDRSEIVLLGVESESNISKAEIKTEPGSDAVNGESAEYPTAAEEKKLEPSVSDLPAESEGGVERSHQASPGTQVTFSESQGTPSSQVSVSTKPKRAKSEKPGSIKKRAVLAIAKRSPLNSNPDSGGKSRTEQQPKEQKSVKRRTSFGSPKPDVSDQEQQRRDSSTSSSSLPSYMQATESARAKAGHSPRSSPDVAETDAFLRKRHSLSGAKDRQDSPRLRRTSSQAQSGSKSNGTSPLERKWQR